jgi:hypothetical protein
MWQRIRRLYDGKNPREAHETGFSGPKTLTPRRSAPIRPAVPWMNVNLNPAAAP